MLRKLILFFAFFFYTIFSTFAQLSTKHYIPPVTSFDDDISEQYIYISTPKNANISFTIKTIGNLTNNYSGIVSNANPFLYRIVENGEDPADSGATLDLSLIHI